MKKILIKIIVIAIASVIGARLLPGIELSENLKTIFLLAITIGVLNGILKPILKLLTIPITILTLGLFSLVINAAMIFLAARLVDGFQVENIVSAFIFSLIISVISVIFKLFDKD